MSVYIAAGRTVNGLREVLVKKDVYDSRGKLIGERCYGWHPETNVTANGVDVCEIWITKRMRVATTAHDARFIGAA